MAGFKTHVTVSSVLGTAYGGVAWGWFEMPPETSLLAAVLCGVSGMLPDLDSGSGRPLRESVAFAAAVVPMFLVHRFARLGLSAEAIVLCGAAVYLAIRFGLGRLLQLFTVHRGMFHSLPAALIAAELGFLLCTGNDDRVRLYKAGAIFAGFMSHLILDELWSIDFSHGLPRLKRSFGTALKLWGKSPWANLSAYAKLGLLTYIALNDPQWMRQIAVRAVRGAPGEQRREQPAEMPSATLEVAGDRTEDVLR